MNLGRRYPRGVTVAELVVASFAFLLVMMVALGAIAVVKRTSKHLEGRSVPRQQLRALLGHLQRDVRAACFLFDTHATLTFGAVTHTFSGAPPALAADPATNDVVYAIVESAALPTTYRVQALFLQSMQRPPYPGAHEMVLADVSNLASATPGTPADIPLSSLPANQTTIRTFATASPGNGLEIRLTESLDGLAFRFMIGHETEGESIVHETYQANFTMRNNR